MLPVHAWVEGTHYFLMIYSRSADIVILSTEPAKGSTPSLGFYISERELEMAREGAPDTLAQFDIAKEPFLMGSHKLYRVEQKKVPRAPHHQA